LLKQLLTLSAVLLLCSQPSAAQEKRNLRVAYVSPSYSQSINWIAKETGIFSKHGLNVELIYMSGGKSTQALVAGSIDFSSNAGPPLVQAGLAGADPVLIISSITVPIFSVIVRPEITKPEDLRGKTIGSSGLNNLSYFITRRVLKKWQLEPDRDVKIIGAANRLATMQQGLIQGTLLSPPENFAALKLGFKSLGEVAEMGINYSYAGIISSKRFVNENPDSTLRFTRSDIEALPLLLRDRSTAVRIVEKYSRISDRAVLEDAYDLFAKHWRTTPLPDREGVRGILEDLAAQEPKAKTADPDNFIDPTFVRKVSQEGLIDKLLGAKK
jgi:NitT/TauT family transport system substrate-binding protein